MNPLGAAAGLRRGNKDWSTIGSAVGIMRVGYHEPKATVIVDTHLRVAKLSTIVNTSFFSHTYVKNFRIPEFSSGFLKFNSGLFV